MWTHIHSRSHPVLIVGIVSIILALCGESSYSLALESRSLVQNDQSSEQGGGRYKLMHWSNPQAPHYNTEVSYIDRFKAAAQSRNERLAALQGGAPNPSPSAYPAPSVSFESPLYNLVFDYGMEITIGTRPRTFSGIADTGSDLVWVQCAGCDNCSNETDPLYDPSKSSTYASMSCSDPLCKPFSDSCSTNNTCSFEYNYGPGESAAGNKAYETVTLTSTGGNKTSSPEFAFGCGLETINYVTNGSADGIVGLGKGPQSFTSQLASLFDNKFSYCLVSIYDNSIMSSSLLFGDAAVPKVRTVYTPMVQNPNASYEGTNTFYYIGLTGIGVNGKLIDIPAGTFDIASDGTGGVILDSATTYTYIATAGYTPLRKELSSLINYPVSIPAQNATGLDLCYDLVGVHTPTFPTVTMVFEGFELELSLENSFFGGPLFEAIGTTLAYCSAFIDSRTFSALGNVAQQNFQVLYDRDARVFGFAQVQCDSL